ncbi:MAG: TIM barrel protein [Lentisphaerae bacterium]|mgnify:FL=1|jgi:hydroxypyruvate isomerase|nr:TIM barrel protein [Lentisphaerota bacterium]
MQLTPCLELFFRDLPFHDRIAAIADCGYQAAEFWSYGNKDLQAIAAASQKHGVTITSCTSTCSDLLDPANHDKYVHDFPADIEAAKRLNCRNLIVLSGNVVPGRTRCEMSKAVIEGLKRLAPMAEKAGITLLLELLNSAVNHPGYFVDNSEEMAGIIRAVDSPAVKALYDIYHGGIMEGNVLSKILANLDIIGHFHAAGIPGRHELTNGEQNYPFICRQIDAAGFDGYLGLEYIPLKESRESLIETREWLQA